MQRKKIINTADFLVYFVDLDGTFYDKKHSASKINLEIAEQKAKTKTIIFATGRDLDDQIKAYIKQVKSPLFIGLNGAKTYQTFNFGKSTDPIKKELKFRVLREQHIDPIIASKIIEFLIKNNYYLATNSERIIYGRRNPLACLIIRWVIGKKVTGYKKIEKNKAFLKISAGFFGKRKKEKLTAFLDKLNVDYCLTFKNKLCEISAKGVSKGAAIELVIKEDLKIDKNKICYIGNDLNDLSAMTKVGCFIAVANSAQGLIERADLIGPKHKTGGVAKILNGLELELKSK